MFFSNIFKLCFGFGIKLGFNFPFSSSNLGPNFPSNKLIFNSQSLYGYGHSTQIKFLSNDNWDFSKWKLLLFDLNLLPFKHWSFFEEKETIYRILLTEEKDIWT